MSLLMSLSLIGKAAAHQRAAQPPCISKPLGCLKWCSKTTCGRVCLMKTTKENWFGEAAEVYCILYILYPVYPVYCISCILYIMYSVYPVSCISCILYILYPVYPVYCIFSILYILYPVYPVSYISGILYILYTVYPVSCIRVCLDEDNDRKLRPVRVTIRQRLHRWLPFGNQRARTTRYVR